MSWINDEKVNTSYSNDSKSVSSFSNDTKNNTSFSNDTKNNTTWLDNIEYLISEALSFLMTESGNYIITNQSIGAKAFSVYTNDVKY